MIDATTIGSLEAQLQATLCYLAEGERLAHAGSWAFDAAGFKHWSSELFVIHGLDPADKAPSIPEYMALVHPEDREFVAQAIEKMLTDHHGFDRSEEHTSELQSQSNLVCRLLLEKKNKHPKFNN